MVLGFDGRGSSLLQEFKRTKVEKTDKVLKFDFDELAVLALELEDPEHLNVVALVELKELRSGL